MVADVTTSSTFSVSNSRPVNELESKETMLDKQTMSAFKSMFERRPKPSDFQLKPAPQPGESSSPGL
jgi:hypothetical protein